MHYTPRLLDPPLESSTIFGQPVAARSGAGWAAGGAVLRRSGGWAGGAAADDKLRCARVVTGIMTLPPHTLAASCQSDPGPVASRPWQRALFCLENTVCVELMPIHALAIPTQVSCL